MASTNVSIPMSRVMKDVTLTVNVTGERRFGLRLKLMIVLLRLAALVSPMPTNIEFDGITIKEA